MLLKDSKWLISDSNLSEGNIEQTTIGKKEVAIDEIQTKTIKIFEKSNMKWWRHVWRRIVNVVILWTHWSHDDPILLTADQRNGTNQWVLINERNILLLLQCITLSTTCALEEEFNSKNVTEIIWTELLRRKKYSACIKTHV